MPKIKEETNKIKILNKFDFNRLSLLILSNVILDNWQIENVEKEFLNVRRTERHGKNYYASFQEKLRNQQKEAFCIYGNQFEDTLNFSMCRYGNLRYTKDVIEQNRNLKMSFSKSPKDFIFPIIDPLSYSKLQKIADDFKPILLSILNKNKIIFNKMYDNSIYSSEVSFEEYFIWVYHIYYTAVTDELINQKIIKIPKDKVSFYVLTYD